jgi:hypothetical protein
MSILSGHRRQANGHYGVDVESVFNIWASAKVQAVRPCLRQSLPESFSREKQE